MATDTPDTYLGQRFAAYAAGWPPAGGDAMPCRELAERLTYALHLYQLVQERYQADRARLLASGAAYDLPRAKYVEQLLTLWAAPWTVALAHLDRVEAGGCEVEPAAAFRDAVLDARVSLSVPVERAAAQAERFAREGLPRGRTTEELRRELRHRMSS